MNSLAQRAAASFIFAILLSPTAAGAATEWFVAPDGNDAAAGTKEKPFATLQAARDAIRAARRGGAMPAGGVTVWLRGGDYRLARGFELTAEDSGTADAPIVYRAAPQERVRLLGGVIVRDWKPVTDAAVLNRLDEQARGHVVQADLKAIGINDFGRFRSRGFGRPAATMEEPRRRLGSRLLGLRLG